MRTRSHHWLFTFVCAVLIESGSAVFAETCGIVKVLKGAVSVERTGNSLPATLGMPILTTDQLVTGTDGMVGITFQDNSLFSLGPNSRLAIEQFQFDSTTHEGKFESALKQGRLAVVSGKIAKHKTDAMKVRTPSTILGVRGTEFLVEVGAP